MQSGTIDVSAQTLSVTLVGSDSDETPEQRIAGLVDQCSGTLALDKATIDVAITGGA